MSRPPHPPCPRPVAAPSHEPTSCTRDFVVKHSGMRKRESICSARSDRILIGNKCSSLAQQSGCSTLPAGSLLCLSLLPPLCTDGGGTGRTDPGTAGIWKGEGSGQGGSRAQPLSAIKESPPAAQPPPLPSTPGDVMALPSLPIVPAPSAPWGPCPTSTSPLATGGPQLRPYAQLCFLLLLLLPLGPC